MMFSGSGEAGDQGHPHAVDLSDDEASSAQAPAVEPQRSRCRIWFGKDGPLRYCSHLDLMRVWERVLRRADVPLVYSQGFNPRPKLQLAAGLPLGYIGASEVLDVWLEGEPPEPDVMLSLLQRVAPPGLKVEGIRLVDLRGPALQTVTHLATYLVVLGDDCPDRKVIEEQIRIILSQTGVMRERRGKSYDLRPLIDDIQLLPGAPLTLRMVLALSQERGTGRPDEVLEALGLDSLIARVTRTAIAFEPL